MSDEEKSNRLARDLLDAEYTRRHGSLWDPRIFTSGELLIACSACGSLQERVGVEMEGNRSVMLIQAGKVWICAACKGRQDAPEGLERECARCGQITTECRTRAWPERTDAQALCDGCAAEVYEIKLTDEHLWGLFTAASLDPQNTRAYRQFAYRYFCEAMEQHFNGKLAVIPGPREEAYELAVRGLEASEFPLAVRQFLDDYDRDEWKADPRCP